MIRANASKFSVKSSLRVARRVECKKFKPIFSKTRSFSITLISCQNP